MAQKHEPRRRRPRLRLLVHFEARPSRTQRPPTTSLLDHPYQLDQPPERHADHMLNAQVVQQKCRTLVGERAVKTALDHRRRHLIADRRRTLRDERFRPIRVADAARARRHIGNLSAPSHRVQQRIPTLLSLAASTLEDGRAFCLAICRKHAAVEVQRHAPQNRNAGMAWARMGTHALLYHMKGGSSDCEYAGVVAYGPVSGAVFNHCGCLLGANSCSCGGRLAVICNRSRPMFGTPRVWSPPAAGRHLRDIM